MKKNISILLIFLAVGQCVFGQTAGENGNWFFHNGDLLFPKSHSAQSPIFPVASLRSDNHKITFSPKEKAKIVKLVEALKDVNPKPKYHSMLYWLSPGTQASLNQAVVDKRQYRFNYFIGLQYEFMGLVNGKLSDQFRTGRFLREWDFLNINVNSMPNFLGGKKGDFGNAYEGSLFIAEEDFTYKKYNGEKILPINGSEERAKFPRDETKDLFVSIESRDHSFVEAAKHFGNEIGMPPLKFGNEADNHFVYRRFTSSRLNHSGQHKVYGKVEPKFDKYNNHTINNMVILSHNNKLPFKPITIERFLNVADKILDEVVEFDNRSQMSESTRKELSEKHGRTRNFIQNLRENYKTRLQEPAIIDSRYSHVSDIAWGHIHADNRAKQSEILNLITDKREPANLVASRFFVSDPKLGKAFYTYDKDFYKNMADGEIRTIAVIWKDYIRTPDNPDFGKGYSLGKDGVIQNRFTDNPDHFLYHFNKKFDWQKFAALLGK